MYTYIFVYKKAKLGDCSQGRPEGLIFNGYYTGTTPFRGLLNFTLDTYLIILNAKQGGIKYHLLVFGSISPEIEPQSPGPLAKLNPLSQ